MPIALLAALALAATATAFSSKPKLPQATGQEVIDFISQSDPYQSWELWPDKGKLYPGKHPHGSFLTTYLNKSAAEAVNMKTGKLPDGSIVVKENYSPEKKLAAITVMYRKAGYNPEAGDWFWLKYGPDGKIMAEGKVAGCTSCHKAVEANDWLFTGPVK